MGFVTTLTGQRYYILTVLNSDVLRIHLYANDRTPSKNDTVTDYTEVVYVGYSSKMLTGSEWSIAVDGLTGNYVATFSQLTWSFTSPVTICGYYVTTSSGTTLLHAERLPNAPITLGSSGGPVKITPTFGFR